MANEDSPSRVLWFIAGAAIGASAALLYAPATGEETRRQIVKTTGKTRKKLVETTGQGREALVESGRELVERGQEMFERGRKLVDEAAEMFERGRKLVEGTAAAVKKSAS